MSPRESRFTAGRVATVLRYYRQHVQAVQAQLPVGGSADFENGWRAACDACLEALTDPTTLGEVLVDAPRDEPVVGWGDRREKSE